MIGMIRRYLKGRARIIAKRQLAQGAKKVARSVKDRDSKKKDATKGIKMIVSRVQARVLAVIVSIGIIVAPHSTFATGIVHDPQSFAQSYAQFVESIEKYNNMIKTAQDTLDTMNRINDVMNTANNTLNNLQTGLADPRQLWDRFQSNVENIKANYERIQKSLENRNWSEIMFKKEFATCKKKWQNLMKQVKEYEEQKAKSDISESYNKYDGSEESEEAIKKAEQKYEDLQETKEIQAELKMIEDSYNGGLSTATSEINKYFDQMQYQVDIFNIEAKARQHKNPYERQRDICNEIDMKQIEQDIREAKGEYWLAIKEGRNADARRDFERWKKEEFKKAIKKKETAKQVLENTGFFNTDDSKATLTINQDTGEINEEAWKLTKLFGNEVKKDDVAKKESIPQTDKDGNTKFIEKWLAKPETIKILYQNNKFSEALSLQNQRNMVLALQGDTQAIQKAQAETMTMLTRQINTLNNTVAAIGKIAAHFLEMEVDIQKEQLKEKGIESDKTIHDSIKNEAILKENLKKNMQDFEEFDNLFTTESGRIKFRYNNKDTSGILGN